MTRSTGLWATAVAAALIMSGTQLATAQQGGTETEAASQAGDAQDQGTEREARSNEAQREADEQPRSEREATESDRPEDRAAPRRGEERAAPQREGRAEERGRIQDRERGERLQPRPGQEFGPGERAQPRPGQEFAPGAQADGQQARRAALGIRLGMRGQDIIVEEVLPNSPAEEAGLKQGDAIVTFNDDEFDDLNQFMSAVSETQVGDEVTLEVQRDGETQEISITPAAWNQVFTGRPAPGARGGQPGLPGTARPFEARRPNFDGAGGQGQGMQQELETLRQQVSDLQRQMEQMRRQMQAQGGPQAGQQESQPAPRNGAAPEGARRLPAPPSPPAADGQRNQERPQAPQRESGDAPPAGDIES